MVETQLLRELFIRLPHGDTTHLSAASALVRVGDCLYVIADDQPYLAFFSATENAPGKTIVLLDEHWPKKPKPRKAAKADLESLVYLPPSENFPHGALFALGSGSRDNRQRGVLLPARHHGKWDEPRIVDLSELFAPLMPQFPELNIEAAFISNDEFILLQRGNKGDALNACLRYRLADMLDAIAGKQSFADLVCGMHFYSLGEIEGTPLCFTDAAALPDGRFAFSAVAENSDDNYKDGANLGSAVGIADLEGNILSIEHLDVPYKVEGIETQILEGRIDILLVTDADAPEVPACLLRVQLGSY